jgi:hypothetical protein
MSELIAPVVPSRLQPKNPEEQSPAGSSADPATTTAQMLLAEQQI